MDESTPQPFNPLIQPETLIAPIQPSQRKITLPPLDATGKNAGLGLHSYKFDFERKSAFLRLAVEHWPNLSAICAAVGISRQCYYDHVKRDKEFNNSLQEIDEMVCDEMEQTMRVQGATPRGFLDRMAYLRAHRPHLYDRAKVVKIEGYKMGGGERDKRLGMVENVVDTEIAKTYLSRREQRERRQERKEIGGGEGAGEISGGGGDGDGKG